VSIGLGELLVVGVVLLLLFGAGRLSEIGRSLGAGLRDFKRGLKSADTDDRQTPRPHAETGAKSDPNREPSGKD
jgi:sec-independent protein translocase protein TatA